MRPLALALLALPLARPAVALPPPSAAQIERLIRQLGADRYADREAASKALAALGKPALPALKTACAAKDAEVRKRARRLVEVLAPVEQRVVIIEEAATKFEWVEFKVEILVAPAQMDKFIIQPKKRPKP